MVYYRNVCAPEEKSQIYSWCIFRLRPPCYSFLRRLGTKIWSTREKKSSKGFLLVAHSHQYTKLKHVLKVFCQTRFNLFSSEKLLKLFFFVFKCSTLKLHASGYLSPWVLEKIQFSRPVSGFYSFKPGLLNMFRWCEWSARVCFQTEKVWNTCCSKLRISLAIPNSELSLQ